MAKLRVKKRSVVLIPYTYQGHVTPMLQLGKILHSKGFSVIVAHPDFNSPNPSNHPEFVFLPLEANLSGLDTSNDILGVMSAMNQSCKAPLVDYLVPMIKDQEKYGQISCIIYDILMGFGNSVAVQLKIPSLVLSTCSAFYMQTYRIVLKLQAQNQIPLREEKMLEPVPELHALRYKDLVAPVNVKVDDVVMDFFTAMANIGSSVGIIWNTEEVLDRFALEEFRQSYKVPSFAIGPFHKMANTNSSTSYLEEDRNCISWLNKQAPDSVLYVSFGSMAVMEKEELKEIAWGLANSGLPFLWVIRPGSVNGSEWIELLPEGFQDVIGERGYIVKWAPQKEVLAHSAVGGFLSHCGWNSTLESICEGVPLICRPHFADQLANTRYITHAWKVGVELEQTTDRGFIERTIKRVMVDDEGKEIRQKMTELKQSLEVSIQKGGSSCKSLDDLTEFICSFPLIN